MINRLFKPFRIQLDPCKESFEEFHNPERGWYFITRITLSEDTQMSSNFLNSRNGLELLEINLMNYRTQPLSQKALAQLHTLFTLSREAKKKVILRFTYDMVGNCPKTEPDDISVIFQHMEDLKELFHEFQDIIYLYQGIFMGSWGEMHDSKYANTVDIQKLFQKLVSVTADNAFIAVRTPALYRTITQCLGVCYKKDSKKGSGFYRLALFNDSFVSSATDFGTYGSIAKTAARHYFEKWQRVDELDFQHELTMRTPSGGETSALYEEMEMKQVMNELQCCGISYLNNEYHPDVMKRWKTTRITEGPYKGRSYYDYIGDHLGYRFVIHKVHSVQKNKQILIHIQILNKGFAPIYREKSIRLCVQCEDEMHYIEQSKGIAFFRDGILEFTFTIDINRLNAAVYDLYLQIYDVDTDCLIACANEGFHISYGNKIGTIEKK